MSAKKEHSGDRLKCSSLTKSAYEEGAKDQIYIGLSDGSHPSKARLQYVQVAMSSPSIVGVYFHPESTICQIVSSASFVKGVYNILVSLCTSTPSSLHVAIDLQM